MKCPKCDEQVDNSTLKCPHCHTSLTNTFDLPKLKEESDILVLSKKELSETRKMKLDEIKSEEKKLDEKKEESIIEESFSSEKNVKTRKSIFFKTIIITFFLSLIIVGILFLIKKEPKENTLEDQTTLLQEYYSTYSVTSADKLLKSIKNDDQLIIEVQTKTKDKFISEIDNYSKKNYDNRSSLLNKTNQYNNKIKSLYNEYSINDSNIQIRVINESDYNYLINIIDKIYNDSEIFYHSIELYKGKSYNEAYNTINNIPKDNFYYKESQKYLELCVKEVLNLLNNDIIKMTTDLESLSDVGKSNRYQQIVLVINSYNEIYHELNLKNNPQYQELLNKYSNI